MRNYQGSIRTLLKECQLAGSLPHGLRPHNRLWRFRRRLHEATTRRYAARLRKLADQLDAWLDQGQPLDPITGRQVGDHGTAVQAITFAVDMVEPRGEEYVFLRAWREGSLDEWPEFYEWLAQQE